MIAFMSADSADHSAWAETKLWVMNADGTGAHVVSGNLDRPISGVTWADDNSGLYFNVESEGSKNLYFAIVGGQFHPVTTGKQVLTVSSVGKAGVAVGVALDADQAERRRDVHGAEDGHGVDVHAAHGGQRRRARGQGARADRGDLVHVEGWSARSRAGS